MNTPARTLLEAVHVVKSKLAALPEFDVNDRQLFDAGLERICNELAALGAVVGERHDGSYIRFCRLRASSTAGRYAALQNWIAAAYRRLDQEALQ